MEGIKRLQSFYLKQRKRRKERKQYRLYDRMFPGVRKRYQSLMDGIRLAGAVIKDPRMNEALGEALTHAGLFGDLLEPVAQRVRKDGQRTAYRSCAEEIIGCLEDIMRLGQDAVTDELGEGRVANASRLAELEASTDRLKKSMGRILKILEEQ